MIKIFNATDTDFSTAGNIIINPLYCHEVKKKSLNGWYIDVEIPIKYKEYIKADKLCVVKTKSKLKPQAFRIIDNITYTTRKIKFTAEHVMFDSSRYVLLDVRPTNLNGQNGLKYVNERTDKTSPFSITSNVENVSTAYFIRKTLLEAWQVFEERWGGVFEADNWNIEFKQSVGKDSGETIIYGKNMQGFEIFEDWSNVCTKILPVGYDGLLLPEKYLESETQYDIPYTKIVDFQTDLETEEQTEANLLIELKNNATKYLEENCIPKVSYTVNSNVNNDLEIGDKIKVLHPFINIFTEVLEYEYDLISEKIKSLTFGNYTRDIKTKFNNIKNTIETIRQSISRQEVIIKEQTNLINSLNKNGYVYIDDNEILILDQLPKEKAKNVWRFGLGGIGFSSKGYEGPFEIAITMDGKINADFITTGTMAVDRIESLASFITDTNASITAIELEQDSITTKVSSVETEVNNTAEKVNNITNTQASISGKNIHIEDSAEEPFVEIKLKGSTTQSTRSGKNIFNKNAIARRNGVTKSVLDTGVRITQTIAGQFNFCGIELGGSELLGKTLRISANWTKSANNAPYIAVYFGNSSSMALYNLAGTGVSGQIKQTTLPNAFPTVGEQVCDTVCILLYSNRNGTGNVGDYVDYTDLIVTVDNDDMTYEDYGVSPSPNYPSPIENVEGNVEIKDIGKNLFDCANSKIIYNNANTLYERLTNGLKIISSGEQYNMLYFLVDTVENLKGKTLTLSSDILFSKEKQHVSLGLYYIDFNGGNRKAFGVTESIKTEGYYTIKGTVEEGENRDYICIGLRPNMDSNFAKRDYTIYDNLQVEIGETATPYTPYQEQKVTFPLAEGQKLMEGSYLAEDGIHNKRKQVVLDGSETWSLSSETNRYSFWLKNSTISNMVNAWNYKLSNYFKYENKVYSAASIPCIAENTVGANNMLIFNTDGSQGTTISQWKTWLSENPVTVEYELAEEEIVPYTAEQQEAWDKIEQLHTYKNVTNIFSDTELDIVYVRDNGLSDMYETKQNASKNYAKTVEKFAEQKITTDEINQKVAVVNEKLTEYKQNIDSFSFTTENAGGINLIQNSTLENGLDLYHSTTGTVSIEKNMDVKEKTISKSAIKIINGTVITQEINVIPLEDYTFSCLVYKTELTNVTIKIVSDKIEEYQIEAEPETWQKFSANINSSDNSVIIEIICDNNFCYISDRILNKGNAPLGWQRHNGEFKSDNVTINEDGITVTNTNDNMKHVITSSEDKIINTLNGKTEVSFNPDETKMNSTRINEKLTKGKVRETVRDDGTVMVTMDD